VCEGGREGVYSRDTGRGNSREGSSCRLRAPGAAPRARLALLAGGASAAGSAPLPERRRLSPAVLVRSKFLVEREERAEQARKAYEAPPGPAAGPCT
jgi:hypothetical protein